MKSVSQQISAYFDGGLTPGEEAALRDHLLEDREHVDDFVIDCFVHTQLIDLLSSHQVRANALVAAEFVPKIAAPARSRHLTGRLLVLAVSMAFVVALVLLVSSRRSVVATVTGTSNAQWEKGAEKRTVGSLLAAGDEIAVERGTIHLTFARGGQVALHGPGRFRVDSDASGQLLLGSVSAFVPEHAVGFTVRTEKLQVVDWGTEFQLDLLAEDSCELQVFDGLVEIQFDQPAGSGATHKKLQFSQGRAIRFDAATGGVKSIEYNKRLQLPMSAWSQ